MMTEAVVRNDIMKHFLSAAACVSKSNSNKKPIGCAICDIEKIEALKDFETTFVAQK